MSKSELEKTKISVNLSNRSYDIMVGKNILHELKDFLTKNNYSKIFVITDENVAKNHLTKIKNSVSKIEVVLVKAGESSKSFQVFENVAEEILTKSIDRKTLLIAFGGGVVGDLTGFVASVLLRGIDFIQIPTTLLAMVDSSVGGKTAINSRHGKNLIGSFYQPKLVLCDLQFLETLPLREFRSGYAEVIKYGFIADKNFFEFLDQNHEKIFSFEEKFLQKIIHRSCEIKAEIVSRDERESGDRALLNFGHTFGHIFETETNYSDEILHGEAVALGMFMATKMSQNFGFINQEVVDRVFFHLKKCGFILDVKKIRKSWSQENLINHLFKDKKNENRQLTFILIEEIGKAKIAKNVALTNFLKVFQQFFLD